MTLQDRLATYVRSKRLVANLSILIDALRSRDTEDLKLRGLDKCRLSSDRFFHDFYTSFAEKIFW
jgi:hypothetical protein